MGAQICVERGLGGIVIITPIAIELWMSSWWNDQGHVESGCGSHAPVDYARSCPSHRWEWVPRLGVPVAHHLARGLRVSIERGGCKLRGSGAFDDAVGDRARWRNVTRGARLARDLSTRLGWDGVCHSYHKRLTCYPRFR
jgi:hypothetical protein